MGGLKGRLMIQWFIGLLALISMKRIGIQFQSS
jgi:hypothetical protein